MSSVCVLVCESISERASTYQAQSACVPTVSRSQCFSEVETFFEIKKITENVNVNWLISSLQRTTQKRVFITVQHKKTIVYEQDQNGCVDI